MKIVLGLKTYDTETATVLFEGPIDMGLGPGDNSYATLYRSPKGQLFMLTYEQVGASEAYSHFDLVEDVTSDAMLAWLEKNAADVLVYEAIGIEIEEG